MNNQFKKTMAEIGAKARVCFRVVFADGSCWQSYERAPDVTILIRTGHVSLLEGYANGENDLRATVLHAFGARMDGGSDGEPTLLLEVRNSWHELRNSNASLPQAKANARFHSGPAPHVHRDSLREVGM